MSYVKEYQEKLRTAEEVAAMVNSNDVIKLGFFNGKPVTLIKHWLKDMKNLKTYY